MDQERKKGRGGKWWAVRIIGALLVVVALGVALNFERIQRLHRVNTLFDEGNIVHNFSHMEDAFRTRVIPAPTPKKRHVWKEALSPLPERVATPRASEELVLEDWLARTSTTSLLVVQHGKIVHESYRLGTTRDDLRISWSLSKSFLSALFGIAVSEGKIASLDTPVTDYVPSLKGSAYDGVPIRHVLNMASGAHFNEDYLDFDSDINKMGRIIAVGGSMDAFAASLTERDWSSGTHRHYVSIDTHVIGMVLRAATGKSVPEYFQEKLWDRLGVTHRAYYVTDSEGVAFVLGGLNLRTRDYARFGQLFLQDGVWLGEQVVPRAWVAESTANSAPPSLDDPFGYGYQWWVPQDADQEFYGIGIYGQYIYVNKKAGVVIVKTSAHRGFRDDGKNGSEVEAGSIDVFRAITRHYAAQVSPSEAPPESSPETPPPPAPTAPEGDAP